MFWYFLSGLVIGLLCKLTITKPADIKVYEQGFKDGADTVAEAIKGMMAPKNDSEG
ncbi:hypothetical protein IGI37_000085 [Enterococcus sp. AZ194]|uniref:hypothetical protein n=1 Tax=Enterococcus sp. AZ194 TaxID=2774629 RepID=UPI003F25E712